MSSRNFSTAGSYIKSTKPLATMVDSNIKAIKGAEFTQTITVLPKKVLYSDVCDMEALKLGLVRVKNKSPGVDGEVKADITTERLKKLLKDLKVQKYQPKSNKRVPISKPGGGVRYLGIASAIDKVVQATLVNLLTPVVEQTFSSYSFGFRPGLGCHDALYNIRHR